MDTLTNCLSLSNKLSLQYLLLMFKFDSSQGQPRLSSERKEQVN